MTRDHLADDLRALQAAGRIRHWWLPGMLAVRTGSGSRWRAVDGTQERPGTGYQIAISDPATVGCLMALLREAVAPWSELPGARTDADVHGWLCWVQTGPFASDACRAATEGEAIAVAIHAVREGS